MEDDDKWYVKPKVYDWKYGYDLDNQIRRPEIDMNMIRKYYDDYIADKKYFPSPTSISSKPSSSAGPFKSKAKIKVDVSHMSKDVGADILQRVKKEYEEN